MGVKLIHKDTVTFVVVNSTDGYGNKKAVLEQHDVKVTFLQDTGFLHSNNQDAIDADAVLYVDQFNAFIANNHHRLEGMYVVAPLYGSLPDSAWYKITKVKVNRDHLLGNKIDNIQVLLKKTNALAGVS